MGLNLLGKVEVVAISFVLIGAILLLLGLLIGGIAGIIDFLTLNM